jgi:hypothetical protein
LILKANIVISTGQHGANRLNKIVNMLIFNGYFSSPVKFANFTKIIFAVVGDCGNISPSLKNAVRVDFLRASLRPAQQSCRTAIVGRVFLCDIKTCQK